MTEGNLQKRQLIFQLQPAVCTFSDLSRLTLAMKKNEKVQNPTEMTWNFFYCSNRPMPDAFALQGVWVEKKGTVKCFDLFLITVRDKTQS